MNEWVVSRGLRANCRIHRPSRFRNANQKLGGRHIQKPVVTHGRVLKKSRGQDEKDFENGARRLSAQMCQRHLASTATPLRTQCPLKELSKWHALRSLPHVSKVAVTWRKMLEFQADAPKKTAAPCFRVAAASSKCLTKLQT
jgi:hypothetical protein